MNYLIVSFDGGGIRGIYACALWARLCRLFPRLRRLVRLFAGNSTGGIIVCGIAYGKTGDQMIDFYQANGPLIFRRGLWRKIKTLGGLTGPKYSNAALYDALKEVFGFSTLGELNVKILIPSFDLQNWKPKFFHNFAGPDSDAGEYLYDIAMRTSAAPVYFPTYG